MELHNFNHNSNKYKQLLQTKNLRKKSLKLATNLPHISPIDFCISLYFSSEGTQTKTWFFYWMVREAAKKVFFFNDLVRRKILIWSLSSRGGGRPLKQNFFLASLTQNALHTHKEEQIFICKKVRYGISVDLLP